MSRHTHPYGGMWQVSESGLLLRDTTLANATTARHGLLPKLSGASTEVLCGDGAYRALGGSTTPGIGYIRSTFGITDAANDNFSGGSLDTTGARFSGANAWAWVNQGTATATLNRDKCELTVPASTGGWRMIVQDVPASTPWLIRAWVGWPLALVNSTKKGAMVLYDSVGGKIESWGYGISPSGIIWAARWNSVSSFNSSRATVTQLLNYLVPVYFEIENDGTNYILRYGMSESSMVPPVAAFTHTNFLDNAADKIGLAVYSDNAAGSNATMHVEEFYRVL